MRIQRLGVGQSGGWGATSRNLGPARRRLSVAFDIAGLGVCADRVGGRGQVLHLKYFLWLVKIVMPCRAPSFSIGWGSRVLCMKMSAASCLIWRVERDPLTWEVLLQRDVVRAAPSIRHPTMLAGTTTCTSFRSGGNRNKRPIGPVRC